MHEVADLPHGRIVLVEDERAQHILLSALKAWGQGAERDIRVLVRPGGTSRIFYDVQAHAASARSDLFVVLDGDHQPTANLPEDEELPQGQRALEKLIQDYTKGPNTSGPSLSFVDAAEATRYLKFLRDRVRFLPGDTPESLVWSDGYLRKTFGQLPASIAREKNHKRKLELVAVANVGTQPETIFNLLVADLINRSSAENRSLKDLVSYLRESTA